MPRSDANRSAWVRSLERRHPHRRGCATGVRAVLSADSFRMNLNDAVQNAKPGDTITVPEGVHAGTLLIDKPLTLKGAGPVKSTIDARRQGACVLINGEDAKVTLKGLTLLNGSSPHGGCVAL